MAWSWGASAGDAPDLVLIHGASGNTRDMTFSLAPRLAEDYRVIVLDRPGLGYTDRINGTGATITQQAELLQKAAAQLGADRPIVLGHSYGGAVALAWAVTRPDHISALVNVSGARQAVGGWDLDLLPRAVEPGSRPAGDPVHHRLCRLKPRQ